MITRLSIALAAALGLGACSHDPTHVIASTATVIGVDLGQGQATSAVTGTLGYKRAEFALVPTNKVQPQPGGGASADGGAGSALGNGARDSADVVMELNYQGIFSSGGGIYQRLAVGPNAVLAPASKVMFAKSPDGKIDEAAVRIANEESEVAQPKINQIAKCFDNGGAVDATVRDPVVTQAASANAVQFSTTAVAALKSRTTTAKLADYLGDLGNGMVPGLFDALPANCR
jgi:hypothetical protein